MFRRLLVFNLALVILVAAGAFKLQRDVHAFWEGHSVVRIQPENEKAAVKSPAAPATLSKEEWSDIAAHNPFSVDRNDVTYVAPTAAAQQPKRPKPFLFGIMKLGNDRMALLGPGDPGNRSYQPVRVGQAIDGWKLTEIADKAVTVQWDEIKETVVMNDPTAQVPRSDTKTVGPASPPPAPVTNVGAPVTINNTAAAEPAPAANQTPSTTKCVPKMITVHTPFGDKTMLDPNPSC